MKNLLTSFSLTSLLKYLKIPVSGSYCDQLINSHPDFPSLLSFVDTLDRLGIPNIAARIEKDKLADLPFPYVLQLATRKDLVFIANPRDLTENKEKIEDWSGIVLHIEPTSTIKDPENNRLYKRERLLSFFIYTSITALLIPFLWSAYLMFTPFMILVYAASIAGLVVGYLLVAKDLGIKFDIVENFCTPAGRRNNCEQVLESEGASFFGFAKLSDLVLIYFLCQACCLAMLSVLPSWSTSVLQGLYVVSLAAVPMVIYSIVYQQKIGTWCKLCLIVDGLLLLQVIAFFAAIGLPFKGAFEPVVIATLVAGSFVITSIVLVFKNQLDDTLASRKDASDAARVKNSHFVFDQMSSGTEAEVEFRSHIRLLSGSKDAPLKFVMASNLYCKPCSVQHEKLEALIDLYPELVSAEYRFIQPKDYSQIPNSNHYVIEYWMRNIRGLDNEKDLTRKLLTDWYEHMDIQKFRELYPMENDAPSDECQEVEKEHIAWSRRQAITRTPMIYLNGRMLPKDYWPADLAIMAPSLANFEKAKNLMRNKPLAGVKDLV